MVKKWPTCGRSVAGFEVSFALAPDHVTGQCLGVFGPGARSRRNARLGVLIGLCVTWANQAGTSSALSFPWPCSPPGSLSAGPRLIHTAQIAGQLTQKVSGVVGVENKIRCEDDDEVSAPFIAARRAPCG